MINVEHLYPGTHSRIVVQANQSLSWRGNQLFFCALCAVSGTIATVMAMLGFWLVVPFTGLELIAVAVGLSITARRSQQREVIWIDDDTVCIEKGKQHPEQRWQMARHWAHVIVERCPKQWYPSRLLIRSHGQAVEVGSFLNEDERQRLASELDRCLVIR